MNCLVPFLMSKFLLASFTPLGLLLVVEWLGMSRLDVYDTALPDMVWERTVGHGHQVNFIFLLFLLQPLEIRRWPSGPTWVHHG